MLTYFCSFLERINLTIECRVNCFLENWDYLANDLKMEVLSWANLISLLSYGLLFFLLAFNFSFFSFFYLFFSLTFWWLGFYFGFFFSQSLLFVLFILISCHFVFPLSFFSFLFFFLSFFLFFLLFFSPFFCSFFFSLFTVLGCCSKESKMLFENQRLWKKRLLIEFPFYFGVVPELDEKKIVIRYSENGVWFFFSSFVFLFLSFFLFLLLSSLLSFLLSPFSPPFDLFILSSSIMIFLVISLTFY